jgi:hypothetical protein
MKDGKMFKNAKKIASFFRLKKEPTKMIEVFDVLVKSQKRLSIVDPCSQKDLMLMPEYL